MATSLEPTPIATTAAPADMDLTFLDSVHWLYQLHVDAWKREERRLAGGDSVLTELTQFDGESDASFTARKAKATYVNFPKMHASTVTGRLRMVAPVPGKGLDFGDMGEIRTRDQIDTPTLAELVYYNADGIGADGSQFPAWFDGIDERAQATGHRWVMVEMPDLQEIRDSMRAAGMPTPADGSAPTAADQLAGFRPYGVEFSPIEVTNWFFHRGQLQFAVVRVLLDEPGLDGSSAVVQVPRQGYYVLVRAGYDQLGAAFQGGGWWLFDYEKELVSNGVWTRTRGQIPMWLHYGETSAGTTERRAISRSSTMELGQIAVSLMDTISARDYDAWDAAASRLYFLGADDKTMNVVNSQVQKRSMMIAVPPVPRADGGVGTGRSGDEHIVTVYDGSTGAVPATVFTTIVDAKFTEAREQSIQQVTSTPDASGRAKEAGDREMKSPLLARRARLREGSENNFIYFAELRSGSDAPIGFSQYPAEFDLAPVVDDITQIFTMLRAAQLQSATLESKMAVQAAEDKGVLQPDDKEAVLAEFKKSAESRPAPRKDPFAGLPIPPAGARPANAALLPPGTPPAGGAS
jgi:hypothetical protein